MSNPVQPRCSYNHGMQERHAVLVTGSGGGGCGRAIALRFAGDGYPVVVSDIDEAGGLETVRLIEAQSGRAAFCRADVRQEAEVRDLIARCETTFGGLSILVNNASSPHPPVEGLAGWIESLQTDLLGTLYATRWGIEAMRRGGGGSIVNIASISALWHGRTTAGGFPGYDVAKMGAVRLTTGLPATIDADGIRVNCLTPGWIATDGPRQYWESLTPVERTERGVPSKLLTPEQIADAVARIAADPSLNGRIVVWWSEDTPRLIDWGDRGYHRYVEWD